MKEKLQWKELTEVMDGMEKSIKKNRSSKLKKILDETRTVTPAGNVNIIMPAFKRAVSNFEVNASADNFAILHALMLARQDNTKNGTMAEIAVAKAFEYLNE